MTIGLPKALLYYRYGQLWQTFFQSLGCDVVTSGETCKQTLSSGTKTAVDENCLPLKIYLGHVHALMGRCDAILVPRIARTGRDEEYCVRLWGLPDLIQNTWKDAPFLSYNLDWKGWHFEPTEFIKIGRALHKSPAESLRAYEAGLKAQQDYDRLKADQQQVRLRLPGPKILLAAQPYLLHDSYTGGVISKMIAQQGGVPLYSDRCDRDQCRVLSKRLSDSLYWTVNKETVGAVIQEQGQVDGIVLLTAFPCGTDSLVNDLVMRKVKGVPLIQILLDEHQAQAGLETRIESFMDILRQRRSYAGHA